MTKYVCIDNDEEEDLIVGEIYEGYIDENSLYSAEANLRILIGDGEWVFSGTNNYWKSLFIPLSEWREVKINEILND